MYARYFHDPLDYFADALSAEVPDESGPAIEGSALVSGDGLAAALQPFAAAHGIADPRAAATEWSKYFFARLIIPTVVIQTATTRRLDLDPAHWRAHCRADGTVARFVFDRPPLTEEPAPGDMGSLIDAVMTPLIAALKAQRGLSARVYASNAAMYYVWALDQLDAQNRTPDTGRRAARALLDTPRRPDGGFNPFHAPLKMLAPGARDGDGEPSRDCRRLCCVRDLDASLGLCANCPRAITYDEAGAERVS